MVRYKTLVIVESPSKCRTIEKYLGPSYLCVASCGHLREIANGLAGTGVGPDKVDEPSYAIIPKKMHYVRQIKTAIAECNGTVILGTDADREGEAIAWHICQLFQLPVDTTPRIVFREITSEALEHAIRNPRVIDMALVRSQQTRQILDLLIGYKTTPLLWSSGIANKKYNKGTKHQNKILSSGRCQTPALRLVYDNELIATAAAASPEYVYDCTAYFTGQNIPFSHNKPISLENINAFVSFYNDNDSIQEHIFHLDHVQRVIHAPPSALKTVTLQQSASSILNLSPSETMECAQSLYEKGFITYHRTDETRISDEFRSNISNYITKTWGSDYSESVSKTIQSQQSQTQSHSPHECIRPINVALSADKAKILYRSELSANECRLYHLIWSRALQSCMTPSACDKLTARIGARRVGAGNDSDCGEYTYTYVYHAYKPVFAGWRVVSRDSNARFDTTYTDDDAVGIDAAADCDIIQTPQTDNLGFNTTADTDNFLRSTNAEKRDNPFKPGYKTHFDFLANIRNGCILPYNEIKCNTVLRVGGGGRRYTEGSLVRRLENLGIGRPSTFATILYKLQKREYIVRRDVIRNIGTNYNCVNYLITADGSLKLSGPKLVAGADTKESFEFGIERNKLHITESGRAVIDTMMRHCAPLFAYDYTKRMEDELDAIAAGTRDWRDVCRVCYDEIAMCLDTTTTAKPSAEPAVVSDPADPGTAPGTGVLRVITKYASVREGKYGAYIFYKGPKMRNPKFISLKGFSRNALTCDESLLSEWIDEH